MEKNTRKKFWYTAHHWLALPIWVFVFFICLTGTIATVSQEIVWLYDPAVRANPPAAEAPLLSYDEVIDLVGREHPTAIVRSISRPVKSQYALRVEASYPDATSVSLYVNPYTGHIQGQASGLDFRRVVRGLHGWLLMPWNTGYSWGWYLVCLMALPMLGSLISGLVVYRRFWRGYLRPQLRVRSGLRVFWGDFHRLAGIWSIPFIVIISLTGLWFLVQALLYDNHIPLAAENVPVYVAQEDVPLVAAGELPPLISPDQAVTSVNETFPDFQSAYVGLPGNAYSHYWIGGRSRTYPLLFEWVGVNPYNGKVEVTRRIADMTAAQIFSGTMRSLHVGDFVGLGVKLVYFVFGLLLTLLVLSGMLVWSRRTRNRLAAMAADATAGQGGGRRRWLNHLSGLLLLLPLVALPGYFSDVSLSRGAAGLGAGSVSELSAGPWQVRLAEWKIEPPYLEGKAGYMKTFAVALEQADVTVIKAVYLRIGKPRGLRTAGALAYGSPYRLQVAVPIPDATTADAELWLTLEGWDGSVHQTRIPLAVVSPTTASFVASRQP